MNIIEKTASAAEERLRVGLRHLEWAQGLSDETLGAIANRAEWVEFRSGEVIIEVDSEVTHAYFLITGRAQVALYDYFGREMKRETFVRGSLIGLFSMFTGTLSLAGRGYGALDGITTDPGESA